MKIACFVRPHVGGTFSLFRELRETLGGRGFALRWMTSGRSGAPDEACSLAEAGRGHVVDPGGEWPDERRSDELVRLIAAREFDAVMFNVLGDAVETDLARRLPAHVRRLMVVHNITPGTYAAARSIRDHVHAAICVAPRCRDDLVSRYGFDPDRTHLAPNAVDPCRFAEIDASKTPHDGLRLLFFGRIEDISKGVFWLPRILVGLSQTTTLTVAGAGPDLARLRVASAALGERVRFIGPVAAGEAPVLLSSHDVLVMPSRFEGAPMAMVEAMAAGCVPVASRIRGVTDALVEHGRDGLLFGVGDWREAVEHLRGLERDPVWLSALKQGARRRALHGGGVETMVAVYEAALTQIRDGACEIARPASGWSPPAGSRRPLRSRAPEPLKNFARTVRERWLAGARTNATDG